MSALFKNNATALLAASISTSGTTLVLAAGAGSSFPVITGSDYFHGTLYDSANNFEIVKVTARTGDSLTIERAQEGTIALAFSSGDAFAQRVTASDLSDFAQKSNVNAFTNDNSFTGITTFAGDIQASTASFSGAIAGATATFSSSVTGNSFSGAGTGLTGTAASLSIGGVAATANALANSGGWAVTPVGTKLYFSFNGTNVGSLDSSGNLVVIGNVTAYGTA